MQNNNKPSGFRRFLRDNGYYLVIGLCALAVGVSGYFLLRGGSSEKAEETLSVPVTVKTDGEEESAPSEDTKKDTEDAAAIEEETEETIAELPPEETAETADNLTPQEVAPTMRTVLEPVAGETLYAYSMSALAYNETTRDWRTHAGIDLAAEVGAPVSATEAGTVTAVYDDDYLGTTVEITHDSGYVTIYANLEESPAVSVGQTVAAGEVIGSVGSTALLEVGEAPHLHFAVTSGGYSVDPSDYLS